MTGESTEQGDAIARDAVAKLGFTKEQIVQEYGWDDDVEESWRDAIAEIVGSEIEDEDYDGSVDSVLLWFRDGDGDLRIVDRVKDMIIRGGYNVYPKEIETEIDALPGVTGAQVHFETQRIEVDHDPQTTTAQDLVEAVAKVGYTARPSAF
mgnify:CR=1 FL=1